MAKYRLLTKDELNSLEPDFIKYLVLNGITKEDWVRMKTNEKEKAERIVDLFSDVVFEKIIRNIKYLDFYDIHSIKCFKCEEEKIFLIGMDTQDKNYNFSTPEGVARAQDHPPSDLQVYRTSKNYNKERQTEIFKMIESGCLISQGKIYNSLIAMLDNS
jgi:hypothetical protein